MSGIREDAGTANLADPVDRALTALRHIEPPAGLEQRVLQNVEARWTAQKAVSQAARWRIAFFQVSRPSLIACASLAALLLLAASFSYQHHENAPAVTQTQRSGIVQSPPQTFPTAAFVHPPSRTRAPVHQPHEMSSRQASLLASTNTTPETKSGPQDDFDHPAPELPLTAQERLLLRIALGNRPQQIATNKRLILPARLTEDTIDFDKFFEPYTLPLTEGDPR